MTSNGIVAQTSSHTGAAERVLVPRLVDGAGCVTLSDGRLRFGGQAASATLPPLPAGLTGVLAGLARNTRTMATMLDVVTDTDGPALAGMLFVHLARFSSQGLLAHHLVVDHEEYASIEPTGMNYRFLVQPIVAGKQMHLSRFTILRRDGDHMVMESGLGHGMIRIRNATLMALLGMLANPLTPEELNRSAGALGLSTDVVSGFLTLLANGGHLAAPDEAERADLAMWNARDLLFHMSSRFGRMGGPYGGNFRHIDEVEPAPAVRPLPAGERTPLPVPVLEELVRDDPPLQRVVEERRSIYTYGREPITLEDLGEFLYRVARVRWAGTMPVSSQVTHRNGDMEVSSRPVPSGGRGYELELYLTVAECTGLTPGMYHYDPTGHQLTLIRPAGSHTDQMLMYAGIASPGIRPQVLITLAARFRRMMWKYDRLAYAATLKHVGVMMQQMYLAATAMHLAPSAQGSGNLEAFAAATGCDPVVEGSVGEFILGSTRGRPRPNRPTMMYPESPEMAP